MKNKTSYLCLLLASIAVFYGYKRYAAKQTDDAVHAASHSSQGKAIYPVSRYADGRESRNSDDAVTALTLPHAQIREEKDEEMVKRIISSDDAILLSGGLGMVKAKEAVVAEDIRQKRLKSILAKDWEGQGNLLVNELRAGKGFEVEFATVETFLRGKDLFGWPEEQRNWIGDEMMTMLLRGQSSRGNIFPVRLTTSLGLDAAMQALRKGWYLGEDTFRDKLLDMLEKGSKALKAKGSHSGKALQRHDESTAEKIVQVGLRGWKMPDDKEMQESIRKGDTRKVAMAILIKRHTSVSNIWIAERLGMGHDRSVSRLIKQGKTDETTQKQCKELEKMLQCED